MTINTYFSEDGKQFYTQMDCIKYEEAQRINKLETIVMSIEHKYQYVPFANDDHSWRWFKVKSQSEANLVCEFYNQLNESNEISFDEISHFPEWVGVEEGYDDYCYVIGILEQYKKSYAEFIKSFDETTDC